jgi:hypothetical protein
MASLPNLTNAPLEGPLKITNAMGTTVQTVYLAPVLSTANQTAGGAKITRLTAITDDTTTADMHVQISKLIGGVSYPVGNPVKIDPATPKGTLNSNAVDLLTALYGVGGAMNMGAGVTLQAQLSAAVASGKTVTILAEGATF